MDDSPAVPPASEPTLQVVIEPAQTGCRIVARGELDIATASQLADAVEGAEADGADAIVVDLTGVTFVDSTGLSVLVRAALRLGADDGSRLSIIASPAIARVVDLTGLRDRLPLV